MGVSTSDEHIAIRKSKKYVFTMEALDYEELRSGRIFNLKC
jgi:hypothetical protein